ncbi:MAG: DNA recombination protein RmuC [Pseudomonadota bacterium]
MNETLLILLLCAGLGLLGLLAYGVFALLQRDAPVQGGEHLDALKSAQSELSGRVQSLAEMVAGRLDNVQHRLGQSMLDQTRHTAEGLSKLHERLAVIDAARLSITALSSEVIDLKAVLSNKQARGAFGQGRLEAIVSDGLPVGAYEFQATLTNRTRPDCLIQLPNAKEKLVIDAKFPLESLALLRAAADESESRAAKARVKTDMQKHVSDIASKYLIPGETQDFALMFLPSESLFADLHEYCPDIVEAAQRSRVMIVSPSLTMMGIQLMQSLVRDAQMREEAKLIQTHVHSLIEDVRRLAGRVENLDKHFKMVGKDVEDIAVSTRKISSRGEKIAAVDLDDDVFVKELPYTGTGN